ncbi:MAG: DNA polymerase III subunit delta [Treponemataceae bacterium]
MSAGRNYLYIGPEIGERKDAIDAIRTALKKSSGGQLEEHSFYAGETRIGDFASVLMNASLFSETRLVLLKNAELVKKKEDVDQIADYLASPADDTTLILVSDETSIDKRLEAAIPKDGKRVFWEMFEDRKTEWVSSFFKREGFPISPDAVESVLELVENNSDALRQECGRLILFLEKGKRIEAEDIERLLSHTREESAFTLFSRIAAGDLEKALEAVRTLLAAKEAPVQILAGLAWCFRRLSDYVYLVDSGRLNDFELRKAGLSSKKAQRDYATAARRYDAAAVERCVALLAEYDVTLRASGSALEDTLMDLFVYKLIADSGNPLARADYRL